MLEHRAALIFIPSRSCFRQLSWCSRGATSCTGKVGRWSVVLVRRFGAVGNRTDRILSGYVDMFNFFARFAVFLNLADVFIVVAGIALCLHRDLLHRGRRCG